MSSNARASSTLARSTNIQLNGNMSKNKVYHISLTDKGEICFSDEDEVICVFPPHLSRQFYFNMLVFYSNTLIKSKIC